MENNGFRGYTGKNASHSNVLKLTSSAATARAKQFQEEEEERKAQQFAMQETDRLITEGVLNTDGTEKKPKGWFETAGEAVGTAANFVGETLKGMPAAMAEAYVRGGDYLGNVAGEVTGKNEETLRNLETLANSDDDMLMTAIKKAKDQTLSPEQRQRWQSVAEQYTEKSEVSRAELDAYNTEQIEKGDPTKILGTFAEIGLDVVTAGAIKASVSGAKAGGKAATVTAKASGALNGSKVAKKINSAADTGVGKAFNKVVNPTGIKQSMTSGATLGVAYGVTGTAGELGSDASLQDYATNAALGGVLGGALGGSVDVLGKAGRKVFSGLKDRSKNTQDAAQKIIEGAPEDVVNQPGFVDKINQLAAESDTVRDMKASFNDYVNTIKSEAPTETPAPKAATAADTPEVAPESRQLNSGIARTADEVDEELAKMQRGELDDSMYSFISNDGTDITDAIKAVDSQISDIDTKITRLKEGNKQLQSQADGVSNTTGKADIPEGADPSEYTGDVQGRTKAAEGIETRKMEIESLEAEKTALQAQKDESFSMNGGVQKVPNPSAIRSRVQELNAERSAIDTYRSDLESNEMSSTAMQNKLNDLDKGIIPEDLVSFSPTPAATAKEAAERAMKADTQDQLGIQRAFEANTVLRNEAIEELTGLITPAKYDKFMHDLDENYKLKQEEIGQMPKPRQEQEQFLLDSDYEAQMVDMQRSMEADAPRIEELTEALKVSDSIDSNIVNEWNSMQQSNPEVFNDVDEAAVEAYRGVLQRAKSEAELREGKPLAPVQKGVAVQEATSTAKSPEEVKAQLDDSPEIGDAATDNMADNLTSGETDTTIADYALRQPWKVFDKWGTSGKAIKDAAAEGIDGINRFNGQLQSRFKANGWNMVMKDKYSGQTVDFLDTGKTLSIMDGETSNHFNKRVKASEDMKAWFQDVGREMNLPEGMVIKDYLPHIFEKESGLKMDVIARNIEMLKTGKNESGKALSKEQIRNLAKSLNGVDAETRQMIESRKLYTTKNGFLEKRRGAEGWTRDLNRIVSDYSRASAKEIYMKPALEKIKQASVVLESDQLKLLDKWTSQWKGNPSSDIDKFANNTKIPGTNTPITKLLSGARRMQNVALMGASVRTMVLQTTGAVNILGDADKASQFFLSGIKTFQSLKRGSKLRSEAYQEGVFDGSFAELLTGGRGFASTANKVEKAMYSGISAIDQHMRMWAYDVGKNEYASSIGKKLTDLTSDELAKAKKSGVQKARDTQFNMDALSIPVGQGTEMGKMITQIQQFNLKQTEYNFKLFVGGDKSMFQVGKDGKKHFSKKGATRLAKVMTAYAGLMATTTSAANAVFGEEAGNDLNFMGFDPEDLVPFGEQVIAGVNIATGKESIEDFPMLNTPLLSFITGSEMSDGLVDYASTASKFASGEIDQEEYDKAMDKLPSFLARNTLPGGTQAMRTLDYVDGLLRGESVNSQGSTRFLTNNKDGFNILKGLIGGQYATDEGQEWLKTGMNTISANNKVTLPSGQKVSVSSYARTLAPSEQAQYITYYQTKQRATKELSNIGQSRSDATTAIKASLKAGAISQAEAIRRADVWNNKALQMYGPWISAEGEKPARLVDDLQRTVLIDTSTIYNLGGASSKTTSRLNSFYEDDLEE